MSFSCIVVVQGPVTDQHHYKISDRFLERKFFEFKFAIAMETYFNVIYMQSNKIHKVF